MHIELHIPRPGVTLLAIAAVTGWTFYFTSSGTVEVASVEAPPMQTESVAAPVAIVAHSDVHALSASVISAPPVSSDVSGLTPAEMRIKWARAEQEYLRNKENIIRDQLAGLQKEREALGSVIDPALEQQFRQGVQLLTELMKDGAKAEKFLLMAYRQEWEAEERAMAAASGAPQKEVSLFWPVEPKIGISAYFLDAGYEERFKVKHYALDIPTAQGTRVLAAADGIVKDIVDHGLGYNYATIDHGGFATVYGHLSKFRVREGQRVRAGDDIGDSGGMPGEPGGGKSTGPHLHFGLYVNGVPVDPLNYLPKYRG